MLNGIAAAHTTMANRPKSIAQRMTTNSRHKSDHIKYDENVSMNRNTLKNYLTDIEAAGKKEAINERQRKKIIQGWLKQT